MPLLNVTEIERLRATTFIERVEVHAELPSTNDRALRLACADGALPLLIVAERQTAGRGRGTNRWWGAEGSLMFSVLLDAGALGLAEDRWPLVSLAAGLAVGEMLQEFLPLADVRLKWPNDVYLQGRKVCGILVEIPPRPTTRLVIGVGLNVNNSLAAAPPDVAQRAISLVDLTGHSHDLGAALAGILRHLGDGLARLAAGQHALAQRWETFCLLRGRKVHLTAGSQQVVGWCHGIDDQGALLIESANGRHRYLAGTVRCLDEV